MKALIIIDVQNDFLPGGSLEIPNAQEVIGEINSISGSYDFVVTTRDYHPQDHLSFASQHENKNPGDMIILNGYEQVLWPDHCVQGTIGSEIASDLDQDRINKVIYKGTNREVDSYSGFFDNNYFSQTDLHQYLQEKNIQELDVVGLATNYCVKYTVLDAIQLGYKVNVIAKACRGIDIAHGDVTRSIEEMKSAGAKVIE